MHYLDNFSQLKHSLPGNINDERSLAMQNFLQEGLPTKKQEAWKYTSVYALSKKNYDIASDYIFNSNVKPLSKWYVSIDNPDDSHLPEGVGCIGLNDHLNISAYKYDNNVSSLAKLNYALMNRGYIINVQNNVSIKEPIHIIVETNANNVVSNIRNVIHVGRNAEVDFIEHYIGANHLDYWNNIQAEIILEQDAKCNMLSIQEESKQAYHIIENYIRQKTHSSFTYKQLAIGGLLTRNYLNATLDEFAACDLSAVTAISGAQHVDHNTFINHQGSSSTSYEEFRGIYAGSSSGVFRGDIQVGKGVKNIISKQLNKNILLSNAAKVSAQPRLAIYNNDVQCAHGATVGQLDRDALFYLQARGLTKGAAKQIMLRGFVHDLLKNVPKEVAEYFNNKLADFFVNV